MNSSEQKDFEHTTPTEKDVAETLGQIQGRINDLKSDVPQNEQARQGYELAKQILTEQSLDYTDIPVQASSELAKTIAVLAINYLKGECSRQVLLSVSTNLGSASLTK